MTEPAIVPAAVLVPLLRRPEGPALLLTRRAMSVATHKGQIAFPGGAVEPEDASVEAAALREAAEEIALPPERARVLGVLPMQHTWTGFEVFPVVAQIDEVPALVPNPKEVAQIFEVSLAWLRTPGVFQRRDREVGGRRFSDYRYSTAEGVVWGLTGRFIYDLLHSAVV